jgi:hypothetical protein
MNPPDVRTCTPAELHRFLRDWSEARDGDEEIDED